MSVDRSEPAATSAFVRIGSFSRSVGVAPETLRAWEDRYGLLQPRRSSGGFRLYCAEDARLVGAMKRHLQSGLPASEAARRAREAEQSLRRVAASRGASEFGRLCAGLRAACLSFDAAGTHRAVDELLATLSLDAVLADCIVPFINEFDDRLDRGEISLAQQQFSARLLEGRLLAMASGWELGSGPLVLIARGPAERHVIGITAFGLALRNRGWRVVSLGAAARVTALAEVAAALSPDMVVLSLGKTRLSKSDQGIVRALGGHVPVAIAGRAANPALAAALGVRHLAGGPVSAASDVVANRDGAVHPGRSLAASA
jgi:DNA-binding transcriptional MerR regulator